MKCPKKKEIYHGWQDDTDEKAGVANGTEVKNLELWKSDIIPAQGKTAQVAALGIWIKYIWALKGRG